MPQDYYKDLYEQMERAYANEVRKNLALIDFLEKATQSLAQSKKLMEVVNHYLKSLEGPEVKGPLQ